MGAVGGVHMHLALPFSKVCDLLTHKM